MELINIKVIFLDIDGVMNSCFSKVSDKHESLEFDKNCVDNLKRIIHKTDSKIVLSSTWRLGETLESIKKRVFSVYGLDTHLIDMTPFLGYDVTRGSEISRWLNSNKCESFVIIDDDNDMDGYVDNLVLTNAKYGLTKEDADKALDLLIK